MSMQELKLIDELAKKDLLDFSPEFLKSWDRVISNSRITGDYHGY
jgi:hypothetical protein